MITTHRSSDSSLTVRPPSSQGPLHSARRRLRRALAVLALSVGLVGGGLGADVATASAASPVTLQANTGNPNASLFVYRWVYAPSVGYSVWVRVNVAEKKTDARGRFYVSVAPGYYYTYATTTTSLRAGTYTPCYIDTYGQYPYVSGATSSVTVLYRGISENCY